MILSLCFVVGFSQAQDGVVLPARDSVRIGIQAGISFTHFTGHDADGEKLATTENLVRFRGGGNVTIPVSEVLAIRPELLFSLKGYKMNDSAISYQTRLSYLKMPVDLILKLFPLNYAGRGFFKIGAGPYIAWAFHGNYIEQSKKEPIKFTDKNVAVSQSSYNTYYKRYDAGLNYFIEFSGERFYTQLGSAIGFVNIKPPLVNGATRQPSYKNASFNLSYGFMF